ncbi:MAG TPA: hypothetical protein VHW45_17095 [Candidatus Sulfotelmatobacter sp.]|nr:hypothetical protein [Candidatus Sulfotelmatobacter sp.]
MAQPVMPTPLVKNTAGVPSLVRNEASNSGVSWGAVSGGAFVAAALTLMLCTLGAGAGLSSLSPWPNAGVSPSAVRTGALVWLAVVEILSAAVGGYVAGRLRTKWTDLHAHEVYFRDTAHGLLAWSVAFVVTSILLASAATSITGEENRTANSSAGSVAVERGRYFTDSLFRSAQPAQASAAADSAVRNEVSLIFAHSLAQQELNEADRNYVADVVGAKTGLSHAEAEQRVTEVFQRDQQATDAARKAVAHSLYWLFAALLMGAFAASLAATYGGRQRDRV